MKKKIIFAILLIIILILGITNISCATSKGHPTGEVLNEANGFIKVGEGNANDIISQDEMKKLANTVYNILLVVAIVVAVILGAILGIKFITEGADGKAQVQQSLIPYVAGCIIVFGAFTIWKIVVTILQGVQ